MENEKFQVNFAPGMNEATLRVIELQKENVLPVLEPLEVSLTGTIGAVYEYLDKRIETSQFPQDRCHILVNREKMTITLVTNETDERNKSTVVGSLSLYPKFLEFGINSEKQWEPIKLGNFFKMNRAFFSDEEYNMKLVTELKNFNAKIDSKFSKSSEDNGSRSESYSQVVESNLPGSFNVRMPIFKGRPAEDLKVELSADVSGRNIYLSLVSPGAEVIVEEVRNKAIDEELERIKELAPYIAIIEQ